MAFNVIFYQFTKKYNSTKRPASGSGTTYSCTLKDGSPIVNPTIEINLGYTTDPSQFNYCYISSFGRYYYVSDWSFNKGLWTALLSTDVLATYKTQIGAANLYILRASAEKDGRVVDNLYPCKTDCDFVDSAITNPYNQTGCYVIGVVNKHGMYGSITYYALTRASMARVLQTLISEVVDPANGFNTSDASMALQRSVVDPVQYIKSAIWLPVPAANITSDLAETPIPIYDWEVSGATGFRISNPSVIIRNTITLSKHPDTAARGNYVNCAPYTRAQIFYPPFGVVELDTSVTCNASTVNVDVYVDANTGEGNLIIECNGIVLNRITSQIGVPIQISQVSRDYLGAATSLISGIAGGVGSILTGNIAGGIGAIAGGVGNAAAAAANRSNTIGSSGNFSILFAKNPELNLQFFRPVEDDNDHNGRPLCKTRQVSALGGYMLVQDGDVPIPGTQGEGEAVRTFLEGGFYYE